jgi:hypothetical protein
MICCILDSMEDTMVINSKHDSRDYIVIKLENDLEAPIVHVGLPSLRKRRQTSKDGIYIVNFNFIFKMQQY